MAYATTDDVAPGRLGRDFYDSNEQAYAEALLEDLEDDIKTRVPDLDEKVTSGDIPEVRLVKIEARAVARVLRNPDGIVQEADGDYSYTRSSSAASGQLRLTSEEWRQLGVTSGAFTIDTTPPTAGVPYDASVYQWGWLR